MIEIDTLYEKNEVPSLVYHEIKESEEIVLLDGKKLLFEVLDHAPNPIPKATSIAVLDFKKLKFPLLLRPWKDGDFFQPFGMNGQHQKVQDFLTHKKLSRFEKRKGACD